MRRAPTLAGACFSTYSTSLWSVFASVLSALYPSLGQLRSSRSVRCWESRFLAYLAVASFIASCHFWSFLPYAPSAFTPVMASRLYWLSGLLLMVSRSLPVSHLAFVGTVEPRHLGETLDVLCIRLDRTSRAVWAALP